MQMNGQGKLKHANGDIYTGSFKDGKSHGFGIFQDTKGYQYAGNWEEGIHQGEGTETWADYYLLSAKYTGQFLDGFKTGKGKLEMRDGNIYQGDFVNGMFEGIGEFSFTSEGRKYVGQFHNNEIEG